MSSLSLVRRRRWASGATALVLGATLLAPVAPTAAAAPTPTGTNERCADVMPLADVAKGQVGTGWTVVRGKQPKPFRVRILGIYPDGVAPGRDMIMVEVSDLPGRSVVAAGGGIWSGMSGSPVYVDGLLVGAVAYGFSTGPSKIGGLTPAEDMAKLLGMADPSATAVARGSTQEPRTRLSAGLRRALAQRTGTAVAASGEFDRLALPIAVSGVPARGRALLGDRLAAAGIDAKLTRGSTAAAPTGDVVRPVPGGNFAAMISYGDVTIGGVGTTTWVCGDRALAFGHPLALTGPAGFGASDARSLTIIKDPTTGPFKLATLGDPFGTVDQDRLAGIRAHLGETPRLYPVIARVRDADLDATRTGRTQVTAADWVGYVAPSHLYANLISTTDREGPGTAGVRFRVEGTRANGDPWSLDVGDRLASGSSIQYEAAYELDSLLYKLAGAATEKIAITRVHIRATVREALDVSRITNVRISRNGGEFRTVERLRLRAGDALRVRVALRDQEGTLRTVTVPLDVPDDAQGFGFLEVTGGASVYDDCEWDPESCSGGNFNRLLRQLERQPRSDDLIVGMLLEGETEFVAGPSVRVRQPEVVRGSELIELTIR